MVFLTMLLDLNAGTGGLTFEKASEDFSLQKGFGKSLGLDPSEGIVADLKEFPNFLFSSRVSDAEDSFALLLASESTLTYTRCAFSSALSSARSGTAVKDAKVEFISTLVAIAGITHSTELKNSSKEKES